MFSNALVIGTRRLLHDDDAGFSASNPFFTDNEIIDNLTTARDELIKLLAEGPKPPYITLSRMIKTASSSAGASVPADFRKVICGFTNTGRYIPAVSLRLGEAMKDVNVDQIYVRARTFLGTADTALYWAMPQQAITNSAVSLTEFNDGFYHCVKYQAALSLLGKEQDDAMTRFESIAGDLQRKLLSLN